MALEEAVIRSLLLNRTLLVVEDDLDLAKRLCELFKWWGVREVIVRRCATGEEEGGLDLLVKREEELGAACVDIMLPWDGNALRTLDNLSDEWNRLQVEIAAQTGKPGAGERQANLRDRLNIVSQQMREVIDREAGLKIIKQWLCPDSKGPLRVPPVPVLFLTARQEESLKNEAEEISELVKWLTKPATELQVVEALAELIADASHRKK